MLTGLKANQEHFWMKQLSGIRYSVEEALLSFWGSAN